MSAGHSENLPADGAGLGEVRYRLRELLAELKAERSAGLFAQERFSQREIERIFKARTSRHGKRPK